MQGDWPEVVESVALDFAWFGTSPAGAAAERIVIERRPPDFDSLSALMPSFITPPNVVYSDGARQITRPPTSTCCRG